MLLGSKAIATIEIDLRETNTPIDFAVYIDDNKITNPLKLSAKIDGEEYEIGTSKVIRPNNGEYFSNKDGKSMLELELEWDYSSENDKLDTAMGIMAGTISVPVTINVSSHV